MAKLIKDWNELSQIPSESSTHTLEVRDCNAWLWSKNSELSNRTIKENNKGKDWWSRLPNLDVYLSTHTFYGDKHEYSTKILQGCGFDVIIDNWDKQEEGD